MSTKPTPERVEAAVEAAETAETKAEAARVKAQELAQAQAAKDAEMLARAVGTAVTAGGTATPTVTAAPRSTVSVTLSHPLTRDQARQAQISADRDLEAGEQVEVSRTTARSIISSGYATVDPENLGAVQAALAVTTDVEPSATSGN